ncbi:hypothetical protein [Mucilaginibacter terrenus]|uniref:hypothetical protein n=1 Tax=Mucilaginibacter terrenus TaxID=2482727 RepID=UPI001403CFDF|nr:hypothetical protein [Mucilaginibacter terrenus]
MADSSSKKDTAKSSGTMPASNKSQEIKTEGPISEKDEVKHAEQEMSKAAKKNK